MSEKITPMSGTVNTVIWFELPDLRSRGDYAALLSAHSLCWRCGVGEGV
jgi:hypothetical protein